MDDPGVFQHFIGNLLPLETQIRAGVAVEGKAPLARLVDRDNGQRCGDSLVDRRRGHVHAVIPQSLQKSFPEGVRAHTADKRGVRAQTRRRYRRVGGRAAGIRGQNADPPLIRACLRQVHQYLAHRQ